MRRAHAYEQKHGRPLIADLPPAPIRGRHEAEQLIAELEARADKVRADIVKLAVAAGVTPDAAKAMSTYELRQALGVQS